jgi:hypothetical protein
MRRQEIETPDEFEGHVISGALLGQTAEEVDEDVEIGMELDSFSSLQDSMAFTCSVVFVSIS